MLSFYFAVICLGLVQMASFIPTGILFLSGFDIFPLNFEQLPLELYSIPYRLRSLAYQGRDNYNNKFSRTLSMSPFPIWERGLYSILGSIDLFYDTETENIFTKENLLRIQDIEDDLVASEGYIQNFCQTNDSALHCQPMRSVLRYFDGTFSGISTIFYDPNFNNIQEVLREAQTNSLTSEGFRFFLPEKYTVKSNITSAPYTRSLLLLGCSLNSSYTCDEKAMTINTQDFFSGNLKGKLASHITEDKYAFKCYYFGFLVWKAELQEQAFKDMALAVGSLTFIFLFVTLHTRTLWVSSFAIMGIITSFVCANLIYRLALQFVYFGFFHILAIFIILGIGADDVFVFYDAWRLTSFHEYPTLAHRLSDAYSKSVLSMFFTSITTAVAFLCSAISPLLAVKSFGLFAAIAVMVNYLTVIIFFPTVVIMYHLYFENWEWPCFKIFRNSNTTSGRNRHSGSRTNCDIGIASTSSEQNNVQTSKYAFENNGMQYSNIDNIGYPIKYSNINGKFQSIIYVVSNSYANQEFEKERRNVNPTGDKTSKKAKSKSIIDNCHTVKKSEPSILVNFFKSYYFEFATHKYIRWIYLVLFVALVVAFSFQATKLESDTENVSINSLNDEINHGTYKDGQL